MLCGSLSLPRPYGPPWPVAGIFIVFSLSAPLLPLITAHDREFTVDVIYSLKLLFNVAFWGYQWILTLK
jgi:hypothetical protein